LNEKYHFYLIKTSYFMCRFSYCKKYNPKCFFCKCPITRIGEICQSCRYKFNIEDDNCICDENSPGECQSKLDHYCCCAYVFDQSLCRAEGIMHDCICNINPHQCRAEIHDNDPNVDYDSMEHSDHSREEYSSQFNVDISDMEDEEDEAEKNPYSCNHDWLQEWTKPEKTNPKKTKHKKKPNQLNQWNPSNQWNSNQWMPNQWNPNQWNSNQWNSNQWNSNQWNSNQLSYNDDYSYKYGVEDTCDVDDMAPTKRRRR
jgi:hypothetical protein